MPRMCMHSGLLLREPWPPLAICRWVAGHSFTQLLSRVRDVCWTACCCWYMTMTSMELTSTTLKTALVLPTGRQPYVTKEWLPNDSPGIHNDRLGTNRHRSTEQCWRVWYDVVPLQNDVAVLRDDKTDERLCIFRLYCAIQMLLLLLLLLCTTSYRHCHWALEQAAGSMRRQTKHRHRRRTVPFRSATMLLLPVHGDCFFLYVLPPSVATPFRYSALVPHHFFIPLGQLAL